MDDITKKTIQKIKREKITPESKAVAALRKYSLWLLVIAVFLLASFAFAAATYIFQNGDFDLAGRLGGGFLLRSMPFFWIFALIIFILLADYTYGKTTFGYRYGVFKIAIVFALFSMIVGSAFIIAGGSNFFRNSINKGGFLQHTISSQLDIWSHPEQGMLSGEITSVNENSFVLTDFSKKIWNVDISNAIVRGRVSLSVGEEVKIVGSISQDNLFVAEDVRPWIGGMMNGGRGMKMR